MSEWAHPAGPYLVGALLVAAAPPALRRVLLLAAPAGAVVLAWSLPDDLQLRTTLMGQELVWLRVDPLARVFAIVFALIGGLGTLYGLSAPGPRLHVAAFCATGAGLGVVLAGDWLTLYAAWEALAVASWVLITDGRTDRARAAGFRYLLVHVMGGALLLAGIVGHRHAGGSPLVGPLDLSSAAVLILLGFAVNAAVPPLHAWLTDAYPESSPAGGVFLSAFATKAAVYALARVFPGQEVLVWAGITMSLYGVVFAMMQNDIRRLLGYHIVSQVGYMVTGVGLGTMLSLNGTAAHAFSHILYKGLLFMATGAVIHATQRRRLSDLGGLAGAMPATFVLYVIAALSISGAPLLNGFVSKSMVVAGAEADHRTLVATLLKLAAVGTFLSVGLKLPAFAFGGRARGITARPIPASMLAAMGLTAGLCALTGMAPHTLYALLPFPVDFEPYAAAHVLTSVQLLVGTWLAFTLLRRFLHPHPTTTMDVDRAYRAIGRAVGGGLAPAVARAADAFERGADALVATSPAGVRPADTGRIGYAVLVIVAALGITLVLFNGRS